MRHLFYINLFHKQGEYLKHNNFSTKAQTFSKRLARGSNLEASVMALKTATYARSRLPARGSIYALTSVRGAQLNYLLWSARGSTLEPSPVAVKADNLCQGYLRSIFF